MNCHACQVGYKAAPNTIHDDQLQGDAVKDPTDSEESISMGVPQGSHENPTSSTARALVGYRPAAWVATELSFPSLRRIRARDVTKLWLPGAIHAGKGRSDSPWAPQG